MVVVNSHYVVVNEILWYFKQILSQVCVEIYCKIDLIRHDILTRQV